MSDKFQLCPECRDRLGDEDKAALLEDYARKDVLHFQQYDGWLNVEPGDCIVVPDECGDALTSTGSWELRHAGIPVRIQILDGTPPEDAIRVLRKMIAWIAGAWEGGAYVAKFGDGMRPGEEAERALAWRKENGEVDF